MMRELTREEMDLLGKYAMHFNTAIRSQWSRYPGVDALTQMLRIYESVTGTRRDMKMSCSTCILHLIQDIGHIYFDQLEREKNLPEVSTSEENPDVVRVVIKEKKTRSKKQTKNNTDGNKKD